MTRTWSPASCSLRIALSASKRDGDAIVASAVRSGTVNLPQKSDMATPSGRAPPRGAVGARVRGPLREQPRPAVELLDPHPDLLEAVGGDVPEPLPHDVEHR